jgi:hypothetical protein
MLFWSIVILVIILLVVVSSGNGRGGKPPALRRLRRALCARGAPLLAGAELYCPAPL